MCASGYSIPRKPKNQLNKKNAVALTLTMGKRNDDRNFHRLKKPEMDALAAILLFGEEIVGKNVIKKEAT